MRNKEKQKLEKKKPSKQQRMSLYSVLGPQLSPCIHTIPFSAIATSAPSLLPLEDWVMEWERAWHKSITGIQ